MGDRASFGCSSPGWAPGHAINIEKNIWPNFYYQKLIFCVTLESARTTTLAITAFDIITFSITTLSKTKLSKTTFSIMTFSIVVNKMRHSA